MSDYFFVRTIPNIGNLRSMIAIMETRLYVFGINEFYGLSIIKDRYNRYMH